MKILPALITAGCIMGGTMFADNSAKSVTTTAVTNEKINVQAPEVVPALHSWKGAEGSLSMHQSRIVIDKLFEKQLMPTAEIFKLDWLRLCGWEPLIKIGKEQLLDGDIYLTMNCSGKEIPAEGYQMKIGNRVEIYSNCAKGAFYGSRTILQIMTNNPKQPELPKGEILDYPKSKMRMLMLDVGRTFLPYDELLEFIRQLGWVKMNVLHLHFSDYAVTGKYHGFRLQCDTYPGLASKDGFYTKAQIRGMQDFAKLHGVMIIPEIDTPGHSLPFTSYRPDLRHPKLNDGNLDVTNPETIPFVQRIYDEFVPLFDAPYFHIGTDEFRMGNCSKELKLELGEAFRKYINHMNKYVRAKGKEVIIWSGYEHMPGKTEVDNSVIIDTWVTEEVPQKAKDGYRLINSSHFCTYVCPGVPYYGVNNQTTYNKWEPHILHYQKSEHNLQAGEPKLLGGKVHVWGDVAPYGHTYYEIAGLLLPTLHTFSEKMWGTKGSKNYGQFAKRAAKVCVVPGSNILKRHIRADSNGLVYSSKGKTFELKTSKEFIELPEMGSKELEYPWTMTMDVMPTAATEKRTVLMGSSLSEICSELPIKGILGYHSKRTKKHNVDSKERHFGIGIERANTWSPVPIRPTHDRWRTLHAYDTRLELNKWSKITMVGERKGVSLYIDGKLIGKSAKYLTCPLDTIGNRLGDSFIGKIKGLTVYNKAVTPSAASAQ